MHLMKSCLIAFSMYSRIPMPRTEWQEEDMRYVMCFFPLIGLAICRLERRSFPGSLRRFLC